MLVTLTEITPSMIGDRDPWELLHRAGAHIRQQMAAVRMVNALGGNARGILTAHSVLVEAHSLTCDCQSLIMAERCMTGGAA